MDLKMRDFFGLCNTQCFVRVERMDEKRMLQYLEEYHLKMRSPLNSHHKIKSENKSLTGTSVLKKDKKSHSKKKNRKKCKDVEEFEDELKQGKKSKLAGDSGNFKPKKVEKNLKPDSYRENDHNRSNNSKKKIQNNKFKNRWERSFEESGTKKVLKVSWSLFRSSRDRKASTNEEGRTEDVNEVKRKRSKRTKPTKTGELVQKCKKSTVFSSLISSDKVKTENDSWPDKSSDNDMRNDGEVKQSERCPDKESVVVQDSAVKTADVESGVQYAEDDYDFREDNSEDDKKTVIFERDELEKKEIKSNIGTVIFEGSDPEKEKEKTDFQDVTPVKRKKRKKRKQVKFKGKREKKQSQGGIKVFGGDWKNKKNWKSPKQTKFFTQEVLREMSNLVKRLHEGQQIITQLINVMPRSGEIANHFKAVILAQQKDFQNEIWKNHKTIMSCYDDMMSVCKNPLDVTLEISKRTLLNVEDVHNIISQCVLAENAVKHLKECGEWPIKSTFPVQGDLKLRESVQPTEFPAEYSEKTEFGGPEHLKSHSNAAVTNNLGTQISWVPPLRYFATENPASHPDCVQKVETNMSGAAARRDPRQNYNQPAGLLNGTGPPLKDLHFGTQQHPRQTNDRLYSAEATINYLPIAGQQQNDPRCGNLQVQTQPVCNGANVGYVYNVVPVFYPVTQDKIFADHIPDPGGVLFNSQAARNVHPRADFSRLGSRDPRVASSVLGSRDPRLAGEKQHTHSTVPPQIMIHTSSQSSEDLTSAHVVTNSPSENLRKVTSLPVIQPASVQTNNFRWEAAPNTAFNLLRVAQSQPGSESSFPPRSATVGGVLSEKPASKNEARSASVRSFPKTAPVNPVLSRSQYQAKEVTNSSNPGTDSPSSNRTSGSHDPTTPQRLIMKDQRLRAGAVLADRGEKAERKGGEGGVTKGTDSKSSGVENQRTYVCAGDGCKNPGLKVCQMCLSVIYCSDTCQWNHWNAKHRDECYKLKELRG